jgi:hypothetical protein
VFSPSLPRGSGPNDRVTYVLGDLTAPQPAVITPYGTIPDFSHRLVWIIESTGPCADPSGTQLGGRAPTATSWSIFDARTGSAWGGMGTQDPACPSGNTH